MKYMRRFKEERGIATVLVLTIAIIGLSVSLGYLMEVFRDEERFRDAYWNVQTKLTAESAMRRLKAATARIGNEYLMHASPILEIKESIIPPGEDKSDMYLITGDLYTEHLIKNVETDEETNKIETVLEVEAFTLVEKGGSTQEDNRKHRARLTTNVETSNLAGYLWFTDNNFAIRNLYPGEIDYEDSYFTWRDVFDGRVHSNTDIWLQRRGTEQEDDGFENQAEGEFWAVFLKETKTAGHFTGNTRWPNPYEADDILEEGLMNEIMVTDVAPPPYGDDWTAQWRDETDEIEFAANAEIVRARSRVKINQSNTYAVVRAKLEGGTMKWQGGRTDTITQNSIILSNVYDPWNINDPGEPDTIPAITLGMIENARNKYMTGALDPLRTRNDDSYLSPMVYQYVIWEDVEIAQIPTNGSIFVEGELWIEGYVNTNCSVGASGNIRITDNIYYEKEGLDPRENFTSPDDRFRGSGMDLEENLFKSRRYALGLISEQKIIIGYTPANYGVYVDDMGGATSDGGVTIFAGLVAAGDDGDPDANTFGDGMFTFEMWHPPTINNVGEPFVHKVGNNLQWVSFYPVDLDDDGDVDIMLDWNNPRDLQHLFYYDMVPGNGQKWLMSNVLLGSNPFGLNPAGTGPIQAGHYSYQAWEWNEDWEPQASNFIIPNLKNRGTIHLCGALAQRIRGHSRRTPFDDSEGGVQGFENYEDGGQNGYNRDYVYDQRFHVKHKYYNPPPNYPRAQIKGESQNDDTLPYYFKAMKPRDNNEE